MQTESTIKDAIARSISHTEVVRVDATSLTYALAEVKAQSQDYDYSEEINYDYDFYDVYGETSQGNFRLKLVIAK